MAVAIVVWTDSEFLFFCLSPNLLSRRAVTDKEGVKIFYCWGKLEVLLNPPQILIFAGNAKVAVVQNEKWA